MEYSKIIAEAKDRFSNPRPQNFPLPWDMMKYIQKKWSPKVYLKLIRTCKYFYASQPWLVLNYSEHYSSFFRRILNEGLKKNLKVWIARELPEKEISFRLSELTSEARFSQLLHSIRCSLLNHLSIENRKLSYSDYITVTKFKSVKFLALENTNVTTENDENKICFIDDLLRPLKNVNTFWFNSENGSDYYFESAKRLSNLEVSETLQALFVYRIPEYISFKYFHQFLQKNSSIRLLILHFLTADINNTFINDVQSYYSETLNYNKRVSNPIIEFNIYVGNLKIEVSFYNICKMCNQGVANKFLERRFCPLKIVHWICKTCHDAFQLGNPCPFCLTGV